MYFAGYPPHTYPLSRFLPPLPEGVAAAYAEQLTAPNEVVLDAFGQSPRVALELARLGRKVIVASNNPVLRLALTATLDPVSTASLRLVLTRLADVRLTNDRLETYLRSLYRSTCPVCQNPVEVDAYEWERESLVEKFFHCEHCNIDRSTPVDEADVELAGRISARGPHYHWALEQIAPGNDPDRDLYAEALTAYTPRALSALFTLTNKIPNLQLTPPERRALDVLLLVAYDEALAFPASGQRPRSFKPHQRFRERNIWLALERLARDGGWQSDGGPPVPLVPLAEIGTQAGVAIHAGSVRDLARSLRAKSIPCVISALPRPNLVFWTLSSLWAAWLWGQAAAEPLAQLINRRRYDWAWHESALRSSFAALQEVLGHTGRFVALLPQAEQGFVSATLLAADAAQFSLVDQSLRADPPEAQFIFQPDTLVSSPPDNLPVLIRTSAHESAQQVLRQRGEPSRWVSLNGAIYVGLAHQHLLRQAVAALGDDPYKGVEDAVEAACVKSNRLVDLRNAETEPDSSRAAAGVWWLVDPQEASPPLADRTEQAVVQALAKAPDAGLDFAALEQQVCDAMPGLTLPGSNLVRACVESYGEEHDGLWTFRPEDQTLARVKDFDQLLQELQVLGLRLGYTPSLAPGGQVVWQVGGPPLLDYHFYVTQTAQVGQFLLGAGGFAQPANILRFIVIPGGRSALSNYKIKRDPRLKLAVEEGGWQFVKYRHIRRLLAEPALTATELVTILDRDPPTEQPASQLPLW